MGKICFFNTAKAWGGGEKWHLEVSEYLHSLGHPVLVIAHNESELLKRLRLKNIPCLGISINNLSFLNPLTYQKLSKVFKLEKITSLVMNMSRDVKVAGPSAKTSGIKRIIYRRGSAIPIKNTVLNRYYFKNIITQILANSEATKATITANNPSLFNPAKIKVIYNGIEIKTIKETAPNSKFTICNLGRLEYQKNQKFLVQLASQLKERHLNFKLIIGGEGSLRPSLEEQIKELKVEQFVELPGFIKDPLPFINQADVFVLPSLWEGFGYVLAEASLCKKPIVAFSISSNPEVILDKVSGYLTKIGDLQEFADKIEYLYKDSATRKKMGQAGYDHIRENFNKTIQLQKIEDYLINE